MFSALQVFLTDLVYNITNQGDAAFGGPVRSSTFNPYLPERPDQPECRRFMSTGSCKYGSDCRFHHPSERIAQWTTSFVGPLGLPLRPVSSIYISFTARDLFLRTLCVLGNYSGLSEDKFSHCEIMLNNLRLWFLLDHVWIMDM